MTLYSIDVVRIHMRGNPILIDRMGSGIAPIDIICQTVSIGIDSTDRGRNCPRICLDQVDRFDDRVNIRGRLRKINLQGFAAPPPRPSFAVTSIT